MNQDPELALPPELTRLIARSLWASEGHKDDRIPLDVTRAWDPHSYGIDLYEPFAVRHIMGDPVEDFWDRHGCLSDIDPDASVIVGSFGVGSDSPIIVDTSKPDFPVLFLRWHDHLPNWKPGVAAPTSWDPLCPDFATFVATIFPNGPARPNDVSD